MGGMAVVTVDCAVRGSSMHAFPQGAFAPLEIEVRE